MNIYQKLYVCLKWFFLINIWVMNLITIIVHKNTFVAKEKDLNNSSSTKKTSSMPCLIDHDILFQQKKWGKKNPSDQFTSMSFNRQRLPAQTNLQIKQTSDNSKGYRMK